MLFRSVSQSRYSVFEIRKRAWEADYFTKALPFAQKGVPVDVPLGDVKLKDEVGVAGELKQAVNHLGWPNATLGSAPLTSTLVDTSSSNKELVYDPNGTLEVGSTTINDLRIAYKLQEWLERNARGGTRYSELIRSHFGVRPQDARLQRAEYIVGVKNPIQISEVLNMTGTDTAPQGTMAGHGISYSGGNWGKYFVQEHGYIIGIFSVMPKTCYQQGIPRHFLKFGDPTQKAWPTFAHLGEQEVENREIFAFQGAPGLNAFGYQSRYMEYKNLPSRVAGEFRSSLDFWHMGRKFDPSSPPALNQQFIEADPTVRVFAVTDPETDHLYCQVMNHVMAVRTLPVYGTPSF